MHFKTLCILLLIKTLKIAARGRIPISSIENPHSPVVNSTENINLPRGFNPQPSPMNPLLYPFATEEPMRAVTGTTSGWRPMIANRTTPTTTTASPALMPFKEDRLGAVSRESQQESKIIEGPVMESIVYGTWKPEKPIQPKQLEEEKRIAGSEDDNEYSSSYKNVIRRRLGGFIEEIGRRTPLKHSSEKSSSLESEEQTKNSNKRSQKKSGRRKIPNFTEKKNDEQLRHETDNSMKVVKVNSTDPELINIVKQINESVEAPAFAKNPSKEIHSNEESYAPKLHNSNSNNKKISREWPIDFITSNEGSQAQDSNPSEKFFNFIGDSSEPPQAVASLNFDELLAPTTAFNITKMGIPYEDQNSGEEPSICVPLAVQERSISNPNEIVDVERVYCFPLPASEIKRGMENETVTMDQDAHFSVSSYEELTISKGRSIKGSILYIFVISISGLVFHFRDNN